MHDSSIIERASRSVVNQVYVEVDFCATSSRILRFGAKQSIQKRPSKCNFLSRGLRGTKSCERPENAANFSDVHFCCPAQHFLALFLKLFCFLFLLVLLARPVPVISLLGAILGPSCGHFWHYVGAAGWPFLRDVIVFFAFPSPSSLPTSFKLDFSFLLAKVHFCATSSRFVDHGGPKMTPRWPQDGPKMAPRGPEDGPRWFQAGPKTAQRRPKDGPRRFNMGPSWAQDGSKMPQDALRCPKMPLRCLQDAPRCSKMPQVAPKMLLRCLQDTPRCL